MDANDQSQLEESLRRLSWWTGPEPKLWRRALSRAGASRRAGTGRLGRIARSRWTWFGVPIAAMVVAGIGVDRVYRTSRGAVCSADLASDGTTIGTQGYGAPGWTFSQEAAGGKQIMSPSSFGGAFGETDSAPDYWRRVPAGAQAPKEFISPSTEGPSGDTTVGVGQARSFGVPSSRPDTWNSEYSLSTPSPWQAEGTGDTRSTVRKGSLDLQADDVRTAYLKVQMIPSEAEGEYVEQSQISGTGVDVRGYVTLRVRGGRLNVVLNSLRSLATVSREQIEASDVTPQVIDLEARLRNEQRVEKELLDLLEKRKDSPLADVLKLSESLGAVRERIERLVAQQQQLDRQVALATLLVTINPKDRPVVDPGLTQRLGNVLSSACTDGAAFLIATIGGVMRVLIGGLVWWVLLFTGIWAARRRYLRYVDGNKPLE
jgi:hypothetical protein